MKLEMHIKYLSDFKMKIMQTKIILLQSEYLLSLNLIRYRMYFQNSKSKTNLKEVWVANFKMK